MLFVTTHRFPRTLCHLKDNHILHLQLTISIASLRILYQMTNLIIVQLIIMYANALKTTFFTVSNVTTFFSSISLDHGLYFFRSSLTNTLVHRRSRSLNILSEYIYTRSDHAHSVKRHQFFTHNFECRNARVNLCDNSCNCYLFWENCLRAAKMKLTIVLLVSIGVTFYAQHVVSERKLVKSNDRTLFIRSLPGYPGGRSDLYEVYMEPYHYVSFFFWKNKKLLSISNFLVCQQSLR